MKSSSTKVEYNPGDIEPKWPSSVPLSGTSAGKEDYNPSAIEQKWQGIWEQRKVFSPKLKEAKKPFYNLNMFPYPSAEGMHVGNMYAFTGGDIYGRFQRMQGYDVFEPIGLDGFGIHSENYAIKLGEHPKVVAKRTEENFYKQLRRTGNSYDWQHTLETYDPSYYKWTQWIFVQMFKAGLAYRKEAPLNYCPSCKTVLADEQVIDGKCERCGTEVETRKMSQWFFRITKYAGKLLENTYKIDWPEKVLIGQRNWIGKSTGSQITFKIQGRDIPIEVFTTRIDTVYGVTAIVIAPDTSLPMEIATSNQKQAVTNYIKNSRPSDRNEKTGVFTGAYAINPFSSELIPIWVGNYVVGWYGTGAVMVVPGHDERDFEFANKYDLPVKRVIKTKQGDLPSTDYGVLVDSGEFSGLSSKEAILAMNKYLEDTGSGKGTVQYKLRDWIISRQRYWGAPIPMIYCSKCDWQPVPEKDLPVLLPEVEDYQPKGKGKSPLALVDDFVYTACPNCGGPAERETDVCDTFLDSAWYFLRYPSVKNTSDGGPASGGDSSEVKEVLPWDPEITRKWLPVTKYIGGAEHTVLHLLYSRFVVMALKDLGYLDFNEPFPSFFAHGLIIKEGAKMSKSKGNVVVPDEYIKKYGSDSLRTYLMFLGPYDAGGDFRDSGMFGMFKFIRRIWNLFHFIEKTGSITSIEVKVALYKTIKKATGDIPKFKFNTTIASFMEFTNVWEKDRNVISQEDAVSFLKILAPFMPHMTEEIYQKIKNQKSPASLRAAWRAKIKIEEDFQSIHIQNWPVYDEKLLVEDKVNIVVQVNGKLRAQVVVPADKASDREYVIEEVSKNKIVKKYVNDKLNAKKIIFVPKRLVNFVI